MLGTKLKLCKPKTTEIWDNRGKEGCDWNGEFVASIDYKADGNGA